MKNTNTPKCSIEGCEKGGRLKRGWCSTHYYRWYRTGDPTNPGKYAVYTSPEESFAARTERRGDCLIWTGSQSSNGYGVIWDGRRLVRVHRYAWERVNGPIPENMLIDHTCYTPLCVNVEHLRVATPSQNSFYRSGPDKHNGKSGVRNVYRHRNKWLVSAIKNGRTYYFGQYEDLDKAAEVAEEKRLELFGKFAGRG